MVTGLETIIPETSCTTNAKESATKAADQELVTSRKNPIVNGPSAEMMYPPPCINEPRSRAVSELPERNSTKVNASGNEDPSPMPNKNTQTQTALGQSP